MDRKESATKLVETIKSLMESDTGLRKSQIKALHQFTDDSEAPYRGIFKLATGVGKTRIMSMLALAHLQNNPNLQIVVGIPSMELFQQEIEAFQKYKDFQDEQRKKLGLSALSIPKRLDMGVFNQNRKDTTNQIIFTSYQSMENLTKRMDTDKVGLLLLDEAHHAISEKRSNAVRTFTKALHYGMTATPWYEPKRDAQLLLGPIVAKVDIVDAIHENALAEFKNVLMVSNLSVDLSKVAKDNTTGDYKEEDFCKAILQAMRGNSANSGNEENWKEAHHYIAKEVSKFYHDYVDEHVGALNEKKCLINCRSQEEARIQAQELNKLFGRMVARVHTSDECDSQTIQDFVSGKLPIVCQVGKLTEGFDMPNLDMTINYPTASFVREAQGAARCIRLPKTKAPMIPPKKMGLVVDIAFKHPEYNNIVDAIRHNKQILFQDVVGIPFVQHDDEELQLEEMSEEELINLGGGRGVSRVGRVNFTIISNARELIRLTREADELKEKRAQEEIEKRQGYTSSDLAEAIGVNVMTARTLIKNYESKTIINPETGEEEACTKMVTPKKGSPVLGFTKLGFEKVIKDWEEAHRGYTYKTLAEVLNINQASANRLIRRYKNETVINPETGEEEPCTKMVKGDENLESLGVTKLGFEKIIKDWEEAHCGYTSTDLTEVIDISESGAYRLIKRYENKKVVNPETGEEEPCTKMVKPPHGEPCLGLTKLGFEKVINDWREEHEGITSTEVSEKLHMKGSTARALIESYEGKKVLNPETGEEEACTKMVTPKKGSPVLGFTKLGFEQAIKDLKEKKEGVSPREVSKKLNNMPKTTVKRFIKRYKGRKVINPETGEEEPCIKKMKDESGQDCIGFTKLGWELALKEYQEKQKRTTSKTLQSRLQAGSIRGTPKAPPIRKRSTPEI